MRPHGLALQLAGTVSRIVRGWASRSRGLGLADGSPVWVRPVPGAPTVAAVA